ncbi:MAG TPA: DUF3473 domain-containing protein [Kofleriaceae bacterium]|jgi:hypothetical protein|nr:DUF3473 domain-containing protein [Kofleriaceae bacterium]
MIHALGIDLEDWYLDVARHAPRAARPAQAALEHQVEVLRGILDAAGTRCTFFVLGTTARRYPGLVRALARDGHEIAAHGFHHRRLDHMTWSERQSDVARSFDTIGELAGAAPLGYRAPYFSLDRVADRERFYELLHAAGFRYSSSCRFATPRSEFAEFPVSAVQIGHHRVPVAGGGYWRILPRRVLLAIIGHHERRGEPFAAYLHPHELDPHPLASSRPAERLWVNLGRRSVRGKLQAVVGRFRFGAYRARLAP